jgi:hypothetical protein
MVYAFLGAFTFGCFSNDELLREVDREHCEVYITGYKEEAKTR